MLELQRGGLPWLPPPPDTLRAELKAMTRGAGVVASDDLVALAGHDLNLDQLIALDRTVVRLGQRMAKTALHPLKLAFLAQATTEYSTPALRATALRHGMSLDIYTPAYGQAVSELMAPDSALRDFGADIAVVAESVESLGLTVQHVDPASGEAAVDKAVSTLTTMVEAAYAAGIRTVILQTLVPPADPWTGHFDIRAKGSAAAQVAAVNAAMAALCDSHSAVLFDADAVAALVGRAAWRDTALWHRAKVPVALDYLPLYAEKFCQLLRALRGRAAKCLVLDLDNTCWGGIIGDDGLEGIQIGQGSPQGEAFLAIQTYALSLKARGVILAVCSKNEEAAARLPFDRHPDMALSMDDFAVFVALGNWTDKASNLAYIAKVLNIGIDALVFLDDNPAERARVRQALPQVAVPEVGDDPTHYPAMLAHGGYFETVGLSLDDTKRAQQYRANAQRLVAFETIGNYDDYLASLDMTCHLAPFDAVGRVRIAQLVNKSNQFNLTTRRYTEAEIAAMEADPAVYTLQVRLADRFGDNGMISVVIFRKGPEDWVCDTWLMSCRVLKRRVEEAVLATVASAAHAAGAHRLVGTYLPSAKNAMVQGHFAGLGFTKIGDLDEGGTRWALDLAAYAAPDLPMTIDGPGAPAELKVAS